VARSKAVQLPSGNSVTINALKLKDQKLLIGVVTDLVKLFGELATTPDKLASSLALFVESKWDAVVQIVEASVPSEEEAEKITGIDDLVEVLIAVYEVNGVPNLLKRLEPMVANVARALTEMVQQVEPEQEAPQITRMAEAKS